MPSAFQLATVAVVLRNILNPTFATFSAVSRKSEQRWVLLLARNSSINRCPMLKPLHDRGAEPAGGRAAWVAGRAVSPGRAVLPDAPDAAWGAAVTHRRVHEAQDVAGAAKASDG